MPGIVVSLNEMSEKDYQDCKAAKLLKVNKSNALTLRNKVQRFTLQSELLFTKEQTFSQYLRT